jgi:hypothetical protein
MDKFLEPQNILLIITFIFYGIVFYIQKTQFQKQKDILNQYEKIFSIINVDEIEKYVELQKKALHLSLQIREQEIAQTEKSIENQKIEIEEILTSSKTNLEKSTEVSERLDKILDHNKDFNIKISELYLKEFEEIYKIIEVIKLESPNLYKKIETLLADNLQKYGKLKRGLLETLK